jgi:hypothetical protein
MATLREVGARLVMAPLILLGLVLLGFLGAAFVVFGRSERRLEIGRGMSRTLNACWDGTGDVTFSAQSFDANLKGKRWSRERLRFVDGLPGNGPGHCERAWYWHRDHKLL